MARHREEEYQGSTYTQPKDKPYSEKTLKEIDNDISKAVRKYDRSESKSDKKYLETLRERKDEMLKHNRNANKILADRAEKAQERTKKEKATQLAKVEAIKEKAKNEPVDKIEIIEKKIDDNLESIKRNLDKIENNFSSRVRINENKASSVLDLDEKIDKFKKLTKTIQSNKKEVDKLSEICQTKEHKLKSINRSLIKRFINLFTGEKKQLKSELNNDKSSLEKATNSLNQSIASKEKLENKLPVILSVIKDHCAAITNQYVVYREEKLTQLQRLSQELESVSKQTKNTQIINKEKAEKIQNLDQKIDKITERMDDLKVDFIYQVKNYQKFENSNLTKNEKKPIIDLTSNAQKQLNTEKERKNKDINQSKSTFNKKLHESEI
ncbi:hypothetical protein ACTNBL_01710 [Enterococcus villorum]|uniref:Uncharacterized protein n=2 Tax=Enterococcus villorum TaxID=112904 RepID=A0A511J2T2_9ENTE|nr:hypothetical protein [Enterococcus villorum]EOH92130.1 hypothetical protein UAO_00580 [Enterococcus villorum ATCC 700913]EOW76626.1 hypothetical protein I591_01934 [Enterococcus villorum ATCC 700913]GEL92315.1 hypothetical protein EVI01_16520 [Enterococcus villorum]